MVENQTVYKSNTGHIFSGIEGFGELRVKSITPRKSMYMIEIKGDQIRNIRIRAKNGDTVTSANVEVSLVNGKVITFENCVEWKQPVNPKDAVGDIITSN